MCGQECDAPMLAATLSVGRGRAQGTPAHTPVTAHRGQSRPLKKPRQGWPRGRGAEGAIGNSPASSGWGKAPPVPSRHFPSAWLVITQGNT